jgi:hypothetical protein
MVHPSRELSSLSRVPAKTGQDNFRDIPNWRHALAVLPASFRLNVHPRATLSRRFASGEN